MKDIVKKARQMAFEAHEGQTRKLGGGPYFAHPLAVAMKLMEWTFPETAVAAAFVHDVIEEAKTPEKKAMLESRIGAELGEEVLAIVKAVTNEEGVSWKEKKLRYIGSVRSGPELAKAVCAADKIHNLESLLKAWKEQGEEVWKKFNATKEDKLWFEKSVLRMLKETWDHRMIEEYGHLIDRFEKQVCIKKAPKNRRV